MADFFHPVIAWLIGLVSIASIIVLVIFTWKLSKRKASSSDASEEFSGHIWDVDLEELNNPLPRWWVFLFYITLAWGLVYLFMYPGLAVYQGYLNWSQESQYEQEITVADETYGPIYAEFVAQDLEVVANNEKAIQLGQKLFSTYCTTCHGSDGRGARGYPNLRDDDWLYGSDAETIKTSIMNGRVGAMPPWEESLGYEGVFNVAAYVRQLAGHDSTDAQVAYKGKEIYITKCAVCHGAEAQGNPTLGAPNLTDDIWLYGGSQKKIIESIAKGRNGNMPPHKEFLGEAKIHILAAYIYSFRNTD